MSEKEEPSLGELFFGVIGLLLVGCFALVAIFALAIPLALREGFYFLFGCKR